MNLKPLGDRVIVKRDEAETKTASGLYIASSAQEKPQTGIVLAVGEGKRDKDGNLIPVPVKEGDRVLWWQVRRHRSNYRGRGRAYHARRRPLWCLHRVKQTLETKANSVIKFPKETTH